MQQILAELPGAEAIAPWLVGLAVAVVVFFVLALAKRILVGRLAPREAAPESHGQMVARETLGRTSPIFLIVLALYAGAHFARPPAALAGALETLLVIVLFIQAALWVSRIVVGWVTWYAQRRAEQNTAVANAVSLIRLFVRVVVWSIALMLILNNLGFDVTALVAGLGVGGIAIALAAQTVLGDLFASLAIVLDRPFVVGDFVIFGDKLGTVERIGIKTTRLRSLSGEQLICANADLLSSRIHNYKRMAERRIVFKIGITYQATPEQVEKLPGILREIVEAQAQVRFDRAHFQSYGDSALVYEVVYNVLVADYNVYMDIQQAINFAIYRRLAAEGIDFAYPTRTLHLATTGGADAVAA